MNDNLNPKKNRTYYFKLYEVIIMVIATCFLSFFAGSTIMELKMNRNSADKVVKEDKYLNRFYNNYNFILENYYKSIDKDELINGAIEGMMSKLDDPYTTYMDEEEYDNFNIILTGTYKGIGIEIVKSDNKLYIVGVIANSPASKAGLVAGDIITSIDDVDVSSFSASEFKEYIMSNNNPEFKIGVNRNGEDKSFIVNREQIYLESVASELFKKNNHKIGYIYISVFAMNTATQVENKLKELEDEGIDSLIIDVRSNNGGHLTTAEKISSLFVDKTYTIYKLKKNGKITEYKSTGKDTKEYPIVVLTNSKSASAAELLTGCLKDNLKATVIGTKTYGKGSVQELISLSNGDQYKITTKEWLTPSGAEVNGVGISPDIEVELSDDYLKEPTEDNDNQLQEAINYLAK